MDDVPKRKYKKRPVEPVEPFPIPEAKPVEAQPVMFDPTMINGMYDVLGFFESLLAERALKIPAPIARQVFRYSKEEKEALAGPTIRVLNKHIPDWMIKYQDEIQLGSLLLALTIAKINAALMIAKVEAIRAKAESEKSAQPAKPEDAEKKTETPQVN